MSRSHLFAIFQQIYSNFGYYQLGAILENVSGKTYAELLAERNFIPTDISRSMFPWTCPLSAPTDTCSRRPETCSSSTRHSSMGS